MSNEKTVGTYNDGSRITTEVAVDPGLLAPAALLPAARAAGAPAGNVVERDARKLRPVSRPQAGEIPNGSRGDFPAAILGEKSVPVFGLPVRDLLGSLGASPESFPNFPSRVSWANSRREKK